MYDYCLLTYLLTDTADISLQWISLEEFIIYIWISIATEFVLKEFTSLFFSQILFCILIARIFFCHNFWFSFLFQATTKIPQLVSIHQPKCLTSMFIFFFGWGGFEPPTDCDWHSWQNCKFWFSAVKPAENLRHELSEVPTDFRKLATTVHYSGNPVHHNRLKNSKDSSHGIKKPKYIDN